MAIARVNFGEGFFGSFFALKEITFRKKGFDRILPQRSRGSQPIKTNASYLRTRHSKNKSGIDLLSHTVTRIVPSALRGLTSLFGMGRGVTPAIKTPEF